MYSVFIVAFAITSICDDFMTLRFPSCGLCYTSGPIQACESICVMSVASVFSLFPIFRVKFKICAIAQKPHMHLVLHEFMICFIYHFNPLLGLYIVDYLYVSFVKFMLLSYCISSYLLICGTFVVKVQNFGMLGVWVLCVP